MFDDSDGTSKREAQRVFLHGTVRPLGRLLAAELSAKLETEIALNFDQFVHARSGRPRTSLPETCGRRHGCCQSHRAFGLVTGEAV